MPHAKAATLPLLVLPPNRLRVLNPVQSLQVMLSLQFTRAGHARRCAALAGLMPSADARYAFNAFMHTLLARRLAAGRIADAVAERHAVEDLWRDPLVNQRWQRLALRLTADDCERIGRMAAERGLAGNGVRWLTAESATDGWALESRGLVPRGRFRIDPVILLQRGRCWPCGGASVSRCPHDGSDSAAAMSDVYRHLTVCYVVSYNGACPHPPVHRQAPARPSAIRSTSCPRSPG